MFNKNNSRRNERTASEAHIKLSWTGASGEPRSTRGTILDCSELGLRVEVLHSIDPRSYVALDAAELRTGGWAGWGSVRYCLKRESKYVVGIELTAGARWGQTVNASPIQ